MALTVKPARTPLRWLDDYEGRAFFDEQARAQLGIAGEEFLRRWDAGEYTAMVDDPAHPALRRLAALIPFAR